MVIAAVVVVVVVVAAIVVELVRWLWSRWQTQRRQRQQRQGFEQRDKFVFKRGDEVFDAFYAEIHDTLHQPELILPALTQVLTQNTTTTTTTTTRILDLNCGTGYVLAAIAATADAADDRVVVVAGIDPSRDMISFAQRKYPHLADQFVVGDVVREPMTFEKNSFSHILCLHKSIYRHNNSAKMELFHNVYHWLHPNGYFVLQLVDPAHFDGVIPAARTQHMLDLGGGGGGGDDDIMTASSSSLRHSEIDFLHFEYRASWQQQQQQNKEVLTEQFRDSLTGNVRQNETTLYMTTIEDILQMLRRCGFLLKSQQQQQTTDSMIFVFERPNFY